MAALGGRRLPTLMTWRLWRALRYPDEIHPLFQRMEAQSVKFPGVRLLAPFSQFFSFVISVLVVFAPVALLVASNIMGAVIAYSIMSAIQRERDQRTYDLIALTPTGLGRANWLIAAACAHRLDAVDRLASMRALAIIAMSLLIFHFLFTSGVFPALALVFVFVALNLDAIQTLILGCLSGMLAQVFREQGAPFAALAFFVFAQIIVVYLPVTGLTIFLFTLQPRALDDNWIGSALLALLMLVLLFVLREGIIRLIWRELERRLL